MLASLKQKSFRNALGTLITILALAIVSAAQTTASQSPNPSINVRIRNFGQMDARFYRGAQPSEQDYKDLAALGVKTVIDLRDDPQRSERPLVESLGMKYISIPMDSKKYPTPQVTEMFLK